MAKKGKTGKAVAKVATEEEEYYPLYVQSSNPSQALLNWMADMSKTTIVYFQSGTPYPPPPPPPPPPPDK